MICHILGISGQHNGLLNTGLLQCGDRLCRMLLDDIGEQNMSGVFTINRYMDNRSNMAAVVILDTELLHKLCISSCNNLSVHLCCQTMTTDLLHVTDAVLIDRLAIRTL